MGLYYIELFNQSEHSALLCIGTLKGVLGGLILAFGCGWSFTSAFWHLLAILNYKATIVNQFQLRFYNFAIPNELTNTCDLYLDF